jgi:23S rRNA (cytosine1962-C5)-methyltransferase
VDQFGEVAIVHADSRHLLDDSLRELTDLCPTGYTKVHPRTTSGLNAEEQRDLAPERPAWGKPQNEVVVTEYGVRCLVRPAAGLSVGLFLDMREVRRWLLSISNGRTVLNLFAYTCSLGVCASLGGALRVVNLDLSRPYLDWGAANYALNACAVDQQDFIYGDAFDWLHRFERRQQCFDLVIVDPPSFSSTPFSVTRDYARLVECAARVVSSGGVLLAATNHAATSDARFDGWLREGLAQASRHGQLIQRWHEPEPDFPIPEGKRPYLKVRALELS